MAWIDIHNFPTEIQFWIFTCILFKARDIYSKQMGFICEHGIANTYV